MRRTGALRDPRTSKELGGRTLLKSMGIESVKLKTPIFWANRQGGSKYSMGGSKYSMGERIWKGSVIGWQIQPVNCEYIGSQRP